MRIAARMAGSARGNSIYASMDQPAAPSTRAASVSVESIISIPNTVLITKFKIIISSQYLDVPCALTCPVGVAGCPIQLNMRSVNFEIVGQSANDPTMQRSLNTTVRLRNDLVREKKC